MPCEGIVRCHDGNERACRIPDYLILWMHACVVRLKARMIRIGVLGTAGMLVHHAHWRWLWWRGHRVLTRNERTTLGIGRTLRLVLSMKALLLFLLG